MDIRAIKTEEIICKVFFELLQTMDFQKITVRMITEKARINRTTFYKHYVDKYQLRDHLIDSYLLDFTNHMDMEFITLQTLDTEAYRNKFKQNFIHLQKNKIPYMTLWNSPLLGRDFFNEMLETGADKLENKIKMEPRISVQKKTYASWYAHLLVGNMLTSLRWWFDHDDTVSVDEIITLIISHMTNGAIPILLS